jgi:hypothetical protein
MRWTSRREVPLHRLLAPFFSGNIEFSFCLYYIMSDLIVVPFLRDDIIVRRAQCSVHTAVVYAPEGCYVAACYHGRLDLRELYPIGVNEDISQAAIDGRESVGAYGRYIARWMRAGYELMVYKDEHSYVRKQLDSKSLIPYYRVWDLSDITHIRIMRQTLEWDDCAIAGDPMDMEHGNMFRFAPFTMNVGKSMFLNNASDSLMSAYDLCEAFRTYAFKRVRSASGRARALYDEFDRCLTITSIEELIKMSQVL